MNRFRQLRRKELTMLPFICHKMLARVNSILYQTFDKQIFKATKHNQFRLLTLKIWEDKYRVSLQYVLEAIVPYYLERFKKHKRGNPEALGIAIPTLTGKHAERLLKEKIAKDFPEGENNTIWAWERTQEIVRERTQDEFSEAPVPSLVKIGSVSKYVQKYRHKIEASRKDYEKETSRKGNTSRPYRGNPFL